MFSGSTIFDLRPHFIFYCNSSIYYCLDPWISYNNCGLLYLWLIKLRYRRSWGWSIITRYWMVEWMIGGDWVGWDDFFYWLKVLQKLLLLIQWSLVNLDSSSQNDDADAKGSYRRITETKRLRICCMDVWCYPGSVLEAQEERQVHWGLVIGKYGRYRPKNIRNCFHGPVGYLPYHFPGSIGWSTEPFYNLVCGIPDRFTIQFRHLWICLRVFLFSIIFPFVCIAQACFFAGFSVPYLVVFWVGKEGWTIIIEIVIILF